MPVHIPLPEDADAAATFDHSRTTKYLDDMIASGVGRGNGSSYKSGISFRQFSSRGTTIRLPSIKLKRTVILFSNVERDLFLFSEFAPGFVDYRENFRLDVESTAAIAKRLRITHPRYPNSPIKSVMTLDAVVSHQEAGRTLHRAYDCKYAQDLQKNRVSQKLQIHAEAAKELGLSHSIVTEGTVGRTRSQTIQWVRIAVKDGVKKDSIESDLLFDITRDAKKASGNTTIADYCESRDQKCGLGLGTTMQRFKGLVWQHELAMPFDVIRPAYTPLHRIGAGQEVAINLYRLLNA